MDPVQTRLEALEQQMHTVNRRLRWWRGLACGLIVLALLTWALPAGTGEQKSLNQRVAALETLLVHFTRRGNDVFMTGANLHLVNGQGATTTTNALGNLIVGYNEPRGEDVRTGSHNVVVGQRHSFSSFGGLVVGDANTISGDFAVVSGGAGNEASGQNAVVSGGGGFSEFDFGAGNRASGTFSVVSGGQGNEASGQNAVVSGGAVNTASGAAAVVSGGGRNPLMGGGAGNTASGFASTVSGGQNRTAAGDFDWVAGSLFQDQ